MLGHIDETIVKAFPMVFEAEAFRLLNDCGISCFGIYTGRGSTFASVRQTIADVLQVYEEAAGVSNCSTGK